MKPRKINTLSQLEMLPKGSVVLDHMGDAWQYTYYHDEWVCAGYMPSEDDSGIEFYFPVTVIYEGEDFED